MVDKYTEEALARIKAWEQSYGLSQPVKTPQVAQENIVASLGDNYVTLSNGEIVDKELYDALSDTDKALLNQLGIEGYNSEKSAEYTQAITAYQASIVTLSNGETVDKTTYDALSQSDKELLNQLGIAGYNTYKTNEVNQQIATYQASVVTLPNGETVDKATYDTLSQADKELLNQLGIGGYNIQKQKENQEQISAYQSSIITLSNGETVDKIRYDALSSVDQALLMQMGVSGFNNQKQMEYQESIVTLQNGDIVNKADFNALSPSDQALLTQLGVSGYNTQKQAEYWAQIKEYQESNVTLQGGDIVNKVDFNALSPSDQALLTQLGVIGFNEQKLVDFEQKQAELVAERSVNNVQLDNGEWVDKNFYNSVPTEITDFISEYSNPRQLLKTKGIAAYNKWATEYSQDLAEAQLMTIDPSKYATYVKLAEEQKPQYLQEIQKAQIAGFIEQTGGSTKIYESLPSIEAQNNYLKFLEINANALSILNFTTSVIKQGRALVDVAPYKSLDANGNVQKDANGNELYDTNKLASITKQDLQNNPTLATSLALLFPSMDINLIGVKPIDVSQLRTNINIRNIQTGGSSEWDTNIVAGTVTIDPLTGESVLPRSPLSLTEYMNKKLEQIQSPDLAFTPKIEQIYYPVVTLREYADYNPIKLAEMGAVIRPTAQETVRIMANVDPIKEELSGTDIAKLFSYGFGNAFVVESIFALPLMAPALAGSVMVAGTMMTYPFISPAERTTQLAVNGAFALLCFGSPILRTLQYIPRALRGAFGEIGATALTNRVIAVNDAIKATSNMGDFKSMVTIRNAAGDLKNFLVAAKDNGVQGLDDLIARVEVIRQNPLAFKKIGDIALTPELENALKYADYALGELGQHPYITGEVRLATEGTKVGEFLGAEAMLKGRELWSMPIEAKDDLFTRINRQLAMAREGVGKFVPRQITRTELMNQRGLVRREASAARLEGNVLRAINDAENAMKQSVNWAARDLVSSQMVELARAEEAAAIAINLQTEIIQNKTLQILAILKDADTLTPNAIAHLLTQTGVGAMALAITPNKILYIVSQASPEVRNQFINQLGLSDTSTISKVTSDNDWSESELAAIQSLAQEVVNNQIAITQDDLTQIIAVPMSEPIVSVPIGEPITGTPTGEPIIGVPLGETPTTTPLEQPTATPTPEITAFEGVQEPAPTEPSLVTTVIEQQGEWIVPSESEFNVTGEGWQMPSEKEWVIPTDGENVGYRLNEVNLPSITEITLPELVHLDKTIQKSDAADDISKDEYMRMLLLQTIVRAEEQWRESEINAVSISDLPFEQRRQAELAIAARRGIPYHPSNYIQFILPLMLLIDAPLVINSIKSLPNNARMSLMQSLPDTEDGRTLQEVISIPELTPQILKEIEEAAQDIWEKQLEEIINPKGDMVTSPSKIEQEIEEIIRKVEETGLPMPATLEDEIRKLLAEPIPFGGTEVTPEGIPQVAPSPQAMPQIEGMPLGEVSPMVSPLTNPLTQIQTLTQTLTESLTNAMTQAEDATQTATQMATETATQTQTEPVAQTQTQVQAQTQAEIETQIQQQKLEEIKPPELIKPPYPPRPPYPPKPPEPPKPPRIIKIPKLGTSVKQLSKEQLEGAIGWKQGIMYKYIYPPYDQEDIINSRNPIQGIPIKEGIRSAYESIKRTRKGAIPDNITREMGMMTLVITDADKNRQPEIHFLEREVRKGRGSVTKKKVNTVTKKKVDNTAQVFNIGV